jgi:hypothetical protein
VCTECAELHRDLVAISAATRSLPHDARAPRDFRISPEQAARLKRRSWVRWVLRPFASGQSATKPMAAAFTSLGIAGLLVATFVPALLGGSAASAPAGAPASAPTGGAGAYAPAATQAPVAAPAGPLSGDFGGLASADPSFIKQAEDSGMEVAVDGGVSTDDRDGALTAGEAGTDGAGSTIAFADRPNLLVLGSLGLLVLGLAFVALRFAARRLR